VVPQGRPPIKVDVVGPICESSDFLAQDRLLPAVLPGEYLAVFSAGAYGFSMSSQYNSRPRAAEIIVDGGRATLVRRRETYDDLVALEIEPGSGADPGGGDLRA
jgi:diaminopimelate decarboxylase